MRRLALALSLIVSLTGCSGPEGTESEETIKADGAKKPSILLVTLDTTRADAIGPDADRVETPSFDALAARGRRFTRAYTTAPQTLPAHASMLTGLYPSGHGIHENARYLGPDTETLAERLREAGYRTGAFVSAIVLGRQFGLGRGFETYDDALDGAERPADSTTDRALAWLDRSGDEPRFLWVHYYDAHDPYDPPEPFRSRYPDDPYGGEIAFVDREMGRLVDAFTAAATDARILVVGDHGESLGEHGEATHGYLLYEGVARVPLVVAGAGIEPGVETRPVGTRKVFDTVLRWAGLDAGPGLLDPSEEVVLGEAMQPYLSFGWQPQVMGVRGDLKVIRAGGIEIYDVTDDPAEAKNLAGGVEPGRALRTAVGDYPLPVTDPLADPSLSDEERERLASLGYVASAARPTLRADAPAPREMTRLFPDLDRAARLFASGAYAEAVPVFERILAADPGNLSSALRLAVAHSLVGERRQAERAFDRAEAIDPGSVDLRHYRAQHHLRFGEWDEAARDLTAVLAAEPDRLTAIEALSRAREGQGRFEEALALLERVVERRGTPSVDELVRLGELRMALGRTEAAIDAFERAGLAAGEAPRPLELGVLYLAAGRLDDAASMLDRVAPDEPGYPMALFKRAQVAVLRGDPDAGSRIEKARRQADGTTAPLIARERLFQR